MKGSKDRSRFYRSVFRRVISRYEEMKATTGTNSVAALYSVIAKDREPVPFNSNFVTVTPSDLICEVEIKAKRILQPEEYTLFRMLYIEQADVPELTDSDLMRIKHKMQEKLGRAFLHHKIFPVSRYMKPKAIR